MNSTHSFTVTRSCSTPFSTNAAHRHFWNFAKTKLGATPGIIQVLHTWNQELSYHVHMHCILSGGGLTPDHKIRHSKETFFLPVHVLRDLFKGKYLAGLDQLYQHKELLFSASCEKPRNSYEWKELRDSLYKKDWCPYIKETFNGFRSEERRGG